MSDEPGDRAQRVLAYGLDLKKMVGIAVDRHGPLLESWGRFARLAMMPRWEQVEVWLGLYERDVWKVDIPDGMGTVERALWYVEREMAVYHQNVIRKTDD